MAASAVCAQQWSQQPSVVLRAPLSPTSSACINLNANLATTTSKLTESKKEETNHHHHQEDYDSAKNKPQPSPLHAFFGVIIHHVREITAAAAANKRNFIVVIEKKEEDDTNHDSIASSSSSSSISLSDINDWEHLTEAKRNTNPNKKEGEDDGIITSWIDNLHFFYVEQQKRNGIDTNLDGDNNNNIGATEYTDYNDTAYDDCNIEEMKYDPDDYHYFATTDNNDPVGGTVSSSSKKLSLNSKEQQEFREFMNRYTDARQRQQQPNPAHAYKEQQQHRRTSSFVNRVVNDLRFLFGDDECDIHDDDYYHQYNCDRKNRQNDDDGSNTNNTMHNRVVKDARFLLLGDDACDIHGDQYYHKHPRSSSATMVTNNNNIATNSNNVVNIEEITASPDDHSIHDDDNRDENIYVSTTSIIPDDLIFTVTSNE